MSKYGEFQTELCHQQYLVAALKEIGFNPEVHQQPQNLIGYRGDARTDKAHIIIRRAGLDSASNDIGFLRGDDGKYRAIISHYDQQESLYGKPWMNKVAQYYCKQKTLAVAKSKGYRLKGQEQIQTAEGMRLRLTFAG